MELKERRIKSNDKKPTSIDYFSLGHPLTGFRSYFALKAREKMFNMFMKRMNPTPFLSVIDIGVTPDETLPESNFFEKLYPYKSQITAASIENAVFLENIYTGLKFVQTNANEKLPFENNQFDILFCSAVIEHVGDYESQKEFIAECLRVSKAFFLTTPNRFFPMDFHTLIPIVHWFPQKLHQTILRKVGLNFWSETANLNLLTPKELKSLFPPDIIINIINYKLLGWPSNIVVWGKKT